MEFSLDIFLLFSRFLVDFSSLQNGGGQNLVSIEGVDKSAGTNPFISAIDHATNSNMASNAIGNFGYFSINPDSFLSTTARSNSLGFFFFFMFLQICYHETLKQFSSSPYVWTSHLGCKLLLKTSRVPWWWSPRLREQVSEPFSWFFFSLMVRWSCFLVMTKRRTGFLFFF